MPAKALRLRPTTAGAHHHVPSRAGHRPRRVPPHHLRQPLSASPPGHDRAAGRPADADHGRFRQKRMQRAHQRRAQHGLVWWLFRRFSMRGQMTISWRRRCVASPEPPSIARHPGGNGSP
ncbi:hypothetical protein OsJ_25688 [Oryza sativa Japonica Group]|uniref:Uncharacterized protein n=1 Tax=Oryza sativa subsp. japonica TaxID=39947 RepID=B9FV15_ORYSJ|nr:hypothetical protein OsJ_25688 [Oryza sativa Japonica Group]